MRTWKNFTQEEWFCSTCYPKAAISGQGFSSKEKAEACCSDASSTEGRASGADLSSFITSDGKYTLEQIAIEVGLRTLGCTGDHWILNSVHLKEDFICCDGCLGEKNVPKEEIIQAAFPFEGTITGFDRVQIVDNEWRDSEDFVWTSGHCSEWTLTNPMINLSHSPPEEAYTSHIAEPQCVCQMHHHFEHEPTCAMKGWYSKC